jgi:hypothetical protein
MNAAWGNLCLRQQTRTTDDTDFDQKEPADTQDLNKPGALRDSIFG